MLFVFFFFSHTSHKSSQNPTQQIELGFLRRQSSSTKGLARRDARAVINMYSATMPPRSIVGGGSHPCAASFFFPTFFYSKSMPFRCSKTAHASLPVLCAEPRRLSLVFNPRTSGGWPFSYFLMSPSIQKVDKSARRLVLSNSVSHAPLSTFPGKTRQV